MFDFNGSWLPGLHRFVNKNDVLLIGNKADLLPKSLNSNRLINWMKKKRRRISVKPVDVLLGSAKTGLGIQAIAAEIERRRRGKDVYVVGCTNVGKSTFINKIIEEFGGEDEPFITTSYFPGTTLGMIDIPLEDGRTLFDTPGIINHEQMAHFVDNKGLKVITPSKEIKPSVYQLNSEQTLFFLADSLDLILFTVSVPRSFVIVRMILRFIEPSWIRLISFIESTSASCCSRLVEKQERNYHRL